MAQDEQEVKAQVDTAAADVAIPKSDDAPQDPHPPVATPTARERLNALEMKMANRRSDATSIFVMVSLGMFVVCCGVFVLVKSVDIVRGAHGTTVSTAAEIGRAHV